MPEGRRQNTKRSRYTTLAAFFNLIANTLLSEMKNPCQSSAAKNLFRKPKITQWTIFDKDTIDEAIFRTINTRNRIYASRSGVRIEIVGKVILRHADLSTTLRYLGKVSDNEAIRWIGNLHG
ncbi:MAG: hypothetical protein GQ559_10520 [Desulfobulbaceae bacterium]|nr:hypothetical protein [Desulfobulbaceae bacterium]